jgi:hypothetical protein
MTTATKVFCAVTVALLLSASSASAQWAGGARTWAGYTAAPSPPPNIPNVQYIPFISDYGSYWAQDNYDTVASYWVGPQAGQATAESCWQSWTGSAVSCPNATSTTTSGTHHQWIDGFGYIGSVGAWDYFYVEFVPISPASISVIGVYWES